MNGPLLSGCILAVIAVARVGYLLVQLRRIWHARSWPSTVAVVLSSGMARRNMSAVFDVAVTYRYRVAGRDYVGTRIRITGTDCESKFSAVWLTKKYRPGAVVHAHYCPGQPDKPVLETGLSLTFIGTLCWTAALCIFAVSWFQFQQMP
ncbi:DUF3592 domain-containing protein [Massilia antarctica]|uniref:DUF3592 domain-containing protein n=1 Tax=Massilia antarctica TaxID=2765360 RepID=UPI001E2E9B29|nr:DUF3592 domain-containing protein [Massilia sp. H27-R4]